MKIIVFSDSHGDLSNMVNVIEREQPDRVFHLGDHLRDIQEIEWAYPDLPIDKVPGNCDWRSSGPFEIKLTLEGCTMLLCHGHEYGVKTGLGALAYHAREEKASIALFGHTHEPHISKRMGVTLCNPGSCGMGCAPSYGVLTLENGTADFRIHPVFEEE